MKAGLFAWLLGVFLISVSASQAIAKAPPAARLRPFADTAEQNVCQALQA